MSGRTRSCPWWGKRHRPPTDVFVPRMRAARLNYTDCVVTFGGDRFTYPDRDAPISEPLTVPYVRE